MVPPFCLRQLDSYYKRKPLVVARRFVKVSSSLARFLLSVLSDVLTDSWDENMHIRAAQMREFTSSNGPAFIKVRKNITDNFSSACQYLYVSVVKNIIMT